MFAEACFVTQAVADVPRELEKNVYSVAKRTVNAPVRFSWLVTVVG